MPPRKTHLYSHAVMELLQSYKPDCNNFNSVRDNLSQLIKFTRLPISEIQKETYSYLSGAIIGLSVILNVVVVVWIIVQSKSKSRPHTDAYIISLAVSDLFITLLTIPMDIYRQRNDHNWALSSDWLTNLISCKGVSFLQNTAVLSSMFILTCLSLDRYAWVSWLISCIEMKQLIVV